MEDLERYGDYNEVDDEPGEKRGIVGIILKILIAVVCLSVVGVVGFRIFVFNHYPDSVSGIIYSDELRDYYNECGGDMNAYTQPLDIMYDDPAEGNFFFDKLVYIPDADHLQVSIRYNTSLMTSIEEKYGVTLDPDADPMELFDFKLVKTKSDYTPPEDGSIEAVPVETVAVPSLSVTEESFMYRYVRLAFDGVDFGLDEDEPPVSWLRLDITVKAAEGVNKTFSLAVYNYALEAIEYNPSSSEVPN